MPRGSKRNSKPEKRVTRYTYDEVKESRTPETGHTALLPAEEQVVTLPMDNGWSKAIEVGKFEGDDRPVVVDMDPATDPVLFWAGKRNKREVPVLPLQRNEIVSESRVAQIIERVRKAAAEKKPQASLFADLEKRLRDSDRSKRVEFYTHEEGWKDKLICGDSLPVMESLLHYEGLRGKVQMIYIDPPYGIKYDSNFQQRVDSTRNDDRDEADDVLTIKAFRDTWALGVHSYLSYLRERLFLCRELLTESGSIFLQISDENVHLIRCLLDEVFGAPNFVALIPFSKTGGQSSTFLPSLCDYLVWYAKEKQALKFHQLYSPKDLGAFPLGNVWSDVGGIQSRSDPKVYAVQTSTSVVSRSILMTTDPGDLVFDPTCGSGTTAFCAERLGRRWITCDTSRVAINVARQRLLGATFDHYKTQNGVLSGGFLYKTINRVTLKSLAYDLEPEKVELVDQPEVDADAVRVCGPFEVMSLGRYSIEDWKGYVVREAPVTYGEPAKLENYIEVICRLYRKDAAIQGASGLVHAVAETEKEKIAISVGPLSGRVTAKQINDAVQDALASGILEVHVLGWAFEANVGEVESQLESRGKVKVELIMIRPDTLAEGLKATQPEMLFSPLAMPDIEVKVKKNGKAAAEATVTIKGVALFDRQHRRTEYRRADSGYVSAWYLDEDYDGDCFVDCQMFFDFKKAPNLEAAVKTDVDQEEFELKLTSQPFAVRGYKRIAVKVVDVYGNESTVVREIT